jgi:hypothetical protein
MRLLRHLLLVVLGVVSLPSVGFAEAKNPQAEQLKRLTARANALIEAGRYAEAIAPLRDAWAIRQTREIACNVGLVERHAGGDPVEAATFLGRCVEWPAPPATTEEERKRRAGFAEELKEAAKLVARVVVRVSPPGADVFIDGRWIARSSPVAMFLPQGAHQITAKLGEGVQTRSVDAPAGTTTVVEIALDQPGPRPIKKPAPPDLQQKLPSAGPRRSSPDGIAVAGTTLGSGSAVVAAVSFALAASFDIQADTSLATARTESRIACAALSPSCEEFASRRDASRTFVDIGVGASISTAIGVAMLVYAKSSGGKTPQAAAKRREAGVIWAW